MLVSVEFMSLKTVTALVPSQAIAVISLRDSSSVRDVPSLDGFWGVLPVHILDICEEHVLAEPGAWALEPTPAQHLEYCGLPNNFAPALSHARLVRSFFEAIQEAEEPINVVVHCSAGVSRSAAVALWASERYGVPLLDRAQVGTNDANPRMLRLLRSLD